MGTRLTLRMTDSEREALERVAAFHRADNVTDYARLVLMGHVAEEVEFMAATNQTPCFPESQQTPDAARRG